MTKGYTVFRHSAATWSQFASARRTTICKGVSFAEARRICANFNDNRTPAQVKRGTEYEFTS